MASTAHEQQGSPPLDELRERVGARVIGRERELELVLATLRRGRDLVLEGPPGTSKTTMLRAITDAWGIPLVMVEGNAELTAGRLIGQHDPAQVLRDGYSPDAFLAGPLVEAMRAGGFLYIEELNRAPEDTLNTLLTAIADREVIVPRLGAVSARPAFRLVASMNPYDNIGTVRLSTSIRDRLCRIEVGYQDAAAEEAIVAERSRGEAGEVAVEVIRDAVALTRATREHDGIRQGSSVRGAIDLAMLIDELIAARGIEAAGRPDAYPETVFEAMVVALSGRIVLDEAIVTDPDAILREIWRSYFVAVESVEPG